MCSAMRVRRVRFRSGWQVKKRDEVEVGRVGFDGAGAPELGMAKLSCLEPQSIA